MSWSGRLNKRPKQNGRSVKEKKIKKKKSIKEKGREIMMEKLAIWDTLENTSTYTQRITLWINARFKNILYLSKIHDFFSFIMIHILGVTTNGYKMATFLEILNAPFRDQIRIFGRVVLHHCLFDKIINWHWMKRIVIVVFCFYFLLYFSRDNLRILQILFVIGNEHKFLSPPCHKIYLLSYVLISAIQNCLMIFLSNRRIKLCESFLHNDYLIIV